MKKRMISMILVMSMLLSLLPVSARAATTVTVGAVQLADGHYTVDGVTPVKGKPDGESSYAYLKGDKLTLHNFTTEQGSGGGTGLNTQVRRILQIGGSLKIDLQGTNTLLQNAAIDYKCGIFGEADSQIEITSSTGGSLTIEVSGARTFSAGIYLKGTLNITGDASVFVTAGTAPSSYGIYGTASISGGSIIAQGSTQAIKDRPSFSNYVPIIQAGDSAADAEIDVPNWYSQKYVSITAPVQPDPEPEIPIVPPTPEAPAVTERTDTTVTVAAVKGQAYRLNGGEWVTTEDSSLVFDNLTAETTYRITTHVLATDQSIASDESEATEVKTKAAAAKAPDEVRIVEVTANSVTLEYSEDWEYSADAEAWDGTNAFHNLTAGTEYTFFVRVKAAADAMPSQVKAIAVCTTPAAPGEKEGYTIDYVNERAITEAGYEISANQVAWNTELTLIPEQTCYVRKAASGSTPASVAAQFTAPARQTAPGEPEVSMRTDTIITITCVEGLAYRLDDGEWEIPNKKNHEFTGLEPGKTYVLQVRVPAGGKKFASEITSISVTTKTASAVPSTAGIVITEEEITFPAAEAWQYYDEAGRRWVSVTGSLSIQIFLDRQINVLKVKKSATDDAMESLVAELTLRTPFDAPVENEGYQIDYLNETLTLQEGYEISTDGTSWKTEAELKPGTTYFVRKAAQGLHSASDAVDFLTPNRPDAPAAPVVVKRTDTSITIALKENQEYCFDGTWLSLRGEIHTFEDLNARTSHTIKTRMAATQTSFAGEASQETTATTLGEAAAAPVVCVQSITANSITLEYSEIWEYSTDGEKWNSTYVFESLIAATEYTFYVRIRATEDALASQAATIRVYTAFAAPAVAAACRVDYPEETITLNEGYEIGPDGQEWSTAAEFEPGKAYFVRRAATALIPASDAVRFELALRPAAAVCTAINESILGKEDGSLTGITDEMEYRLDGGAWRAGPAELKDLAAGTTIQVRIRATEQAPCSLHTAYTIAAGRALTVRFDGNGGEAPESVTGLRYGQKIAAPAVAERTGYRLDGWYCDESKWNFETQTVTEDLTLVAKWNLETYSISYDLAGGTAENPGNYTVETDSFALQNPERSGYTFLGWTGTDLQEKTLAPTVPKGSVGNRTYTAHWKAEEYGISYDLSGGAAENPETYTVESVFTLVNPTREGYTFTGWTGTGLHGVSRTVTVPEGSTGDRSYTAVWTANQYTITIELNGGCGENEKTYTIETETFTLVNPTKEGYEFSGWTGTGLDGTVMTVTVEKGSLGPRTYTATWIPVEYAITYHLGGGTAEGNPSAYTVETLTFSLNEPYRFGYLFAGWSGSELHSASKDVEIRQGSIGDRAYTANWTPVEYNISYDFAESVEAENPKTYSIESADIRLANPTREGYRFAGWLGTGLAGATFEVVIPSGSSGERSYTATWSPIEYSITYDMAGGKQASGDPASYTIETEDFILARPIRTGYEFAGWVGTDLLDASTEVLIKKGSLGDRSYTATWTPSTYPIYYQLKGGSAFGNPASYTVETSDITLNKPTKAGYTFAGWTGTELPNATQLVTIPTGSMGVRVYTATWTAIGYAINYDLNGGHASDNPAIYTIETQTFTLVNPERAGFTFSGWTGTGLTRPTMTVTVPEGSLGDRSYQATWTPIVYAITYELSDGALPGENPASYTALTETFTLINPVREHYRFAGWIGTELTKPTVQVTVPQGSLEDRTYTATWVPVEYPIRYHLCGGSAENPTSYTVERESFVLRNPTRLGYTFAGWTGTGLTEPAMSVTISKGSAGEREYTANWIADEYSITYNLSGGSAENPEVYTVETEAFVLRSPTRAGYTFLGWTGTDLDGVSARVAIPKGSIGNRSYTAHWRAKEFTVSYNLAGGTVSGNPESYTVESETFTLQNPTRRGYTFAGWLGTGLKEATRTVTVPQGSLENRSYTATWTLDSYSIRYDPVGGSAEGNPDSYTVESDAIVLRPAVKKGYTFLGWVGTDLREPALSVTIPQGSVGSRSYTAVWQINTYAIILNYAGGNAENPDTYTVETAAFTLSNPTRYGYTFLGWMKPGTGEAVLQVRIETGSVDDLHYTANWSADEYTITYDLAGGSADGNPASYTVETPSFTLQNPKSEGYIFAGWIGTDLKEAAQRVTVTMGSTGARSYTATWVTEGYSISYDLGGGVAEGNPAIYTTESEDIILNTPVRTGYTFLGWSGTDLDGTVKRVIIPTGSTGNRSYTAAWKLEEYAITYQIPGVLSHSNPLHYNVESDPIVLENPTRVGYAFLGWTGTDLEEPVQTVTIPKGSTGHRTYTANWQLEEYEILYDLSGGTAENPTAYSVQTPTFCLNAPAREGYDFAGWTGADLHSASKTVEIIKGSTGDRAYTATWTPKEYEITLDLVGGTGAQGRTYTIESASFGLETPVREGYAFLGWVGDDLTEPTVTVTILQGSVGNRAYTAVWEAVRYSISYDLAGGNAENPDRYTIESGEIILNNPARVGYTFMGWTGTDLFSPSLSVVIPAGSTGERSYEAVWEAVRYGIRYDLIGGTAENSADYTIESESFTLTNPTRAGYVFAGWVGTDLNAATMTVTVVKGSTGERNYTAIWKTESYHISYDLAGGTAENPDSYTVETDSFILNNPVREGYAFLGWTGTELHSPGLRVEVPQGSMGDRSYTATWEAAEYQLLYRLEGGSVEGNPDRYTIESDEITLVNPTRRGYEFGGWIGTGLTEPAMQVTIPKGSTGVRVYTATWVAEGFRISYDLRGGTAEGNPVTYNVQTEPFTLVNPKRPGYIFTGWIGTDLTRPTLEVTIPQGSMGDRSYTAMWRAEVYPIVYDLAGGTAENPGSYTIESEEIVLNNPTRTGYTFLGWIGTGLTEPTLQVTIPAGSVGEQSYTAVWEVKQYDISYDLAGGTAENPDSYTIESEEIVLNNPTRTGYTFLGWIGTGLTEPTLQVTIPAGSVGERSYTAVWETVHYNIRYDLEGGSCADNPADYTIETESFAIHNPAREGYVFAGWIGTGLDEATLNLTISRGSIGHRHYTATWTAFEETPYKVEHYLQDLSGDGFSLKETEACFGMTGTKIAPDVKFYFGFTAPEVQQAVIKADGSLVIRYEYARNSYAIRYRYGNDAPDGAPAEPETIEAKFEQHITLAPLPEVKGYTFSGWDAADVTVTDGGFCMPAQEVAFTGTWRANRYAVRFHANGGSGEMAEQSFTYAEVQALSENTFTRDGHTFEGWARSPEGEVAYADLQSVCSLTEHDGGSVDLYAVWKEVPVVIPPAPSVPTPPEPPVIVLPTEPNAAYAGFDDVPQTAWYASAVEYVSRRGLMQGVGEERFNPTATTNRAMLAVILWRLEGQPEAKQENPFRDVAEGIWYTQAVTWAAEQKIVFGTAADAFSPDAELTREQLVCLLWRYVHYCGADTERSETLDLFHDADAVSDYAMEAMQWAWAMGFISGKGGGKLDPRGDAMRCELASILMRFLQTYGY